jgi:5,10-methylene-tetrahydrofolate dehydrogenase/methenyl tetrahydrofolate cyclohydrolase
MKRNIIVLGEPVSLLCSARDAAVTMCSVQTSDLREVFCHADILITATGSPHLNLVDKCKCLFVLIFLY